jgi:hypothetical protein
MQGQQRLLLSVSATADTGGTFEGTYHDHVQNMSAGPGALWAYMAVQLCIDTGLPTVSQSTPKAFWLLTEAQAEAQRQDCTANVLGVPSGRGDRGAYRVAQPPGSDSLTQGNHVRCSMLQYVRYLQNLRVGCTGRAPVVGLTAGVEESANPGDERG